MLVSLPAAGDAPQGGGVVFACLTRTRTLADPWISLHVSNHEQAPPRVPATSVPFASPLLCPSRPAAGPRQETLSIPPTRRIGARRIAPGASERSPDLRAPHRHAAVEYRPDGTFPSNGCVRKRTEAPPPPQTKKYRSMAEIMRTAKHAVAVTGDYYSEIRCEECRSGDGDEEMLLCDRCDRGYHLFCLRPIAVRVPTGPWFCPSCAVARPVRKKDHRFLPDSESSDAALEEKCRPSQDCRKRRRRSMPLLLYKKRRRILPFTPTEDPERRLEQMGSLATALTAIKMEFSNDLIYMRGMAPRSANQANLEKDGMQVLCREDKETMKLCRTMYERGECPPLIVVFDSREGFTVQADGPIKDMTFITEYTGDVDYLKERENDDCDSMMTLLLATNPSQSLIICPDKRGNIARFINGINNHTRDGKKKQNLKCVRFNVDGECRVLLVACRDISRGERLYYDYNGYEQEYPTHHFV